MELIWNLNELFSSSEECYSTFDKIDEAVSKLQRYSREDIAKETLGNMLKEYFDCLSLANRVLVYGSLRFYADAKNEKMIALKSAVENKNEEVKNKLSFVDKNILKKGEKEMEALLADDDLKDYRQYVDNLFRQERHTVYTEEKSLLESEIRNLQKEYNEILASIDLGTIDIAGEEKPLTHGNVAAFLAARDRATRKRAFEALNSAYESKAEKLAEILSEIFIRRYRISKIEGYPNVLSASLAKENIAPSIITNLIEAVHREKESLQKYMAIKARYMNLSDQHLYDLGVPLDFGKKRTYPIEEALELARSSFGILGPKYLSIVDDLIKRGHIDAIPDEKKHQTITFSWMGYSFLNYHEAYNDLKNLVHEIGHSVNDSLSLHLAFPYRISSLFAGETASITDEILLNRCLLENANTVEEKCFYLAKEIDNFITSMYRQTMYTEFETLLYEIIEKGGKLDAKTINDIYFRLLKFYYGNDIIYDDEIAVEWTRLGKLYRWSYYSYNYATGLLIANAVYSKLKDGSLTIEKYIEFLSSGSKEYSLSLLSDLGIDLETEEVWTSGFEVLKSDIEELERLLIAQKKYQLE